MRKLIAATFAAALLTVGAVGAASAEPWCGFQSCSSYLILVCAGTLHQTQGDTSPVDRVRCRPACHARE